MTDVPYVFQHSVINDSRLQLYNAALRECGERKLASLSDDYGPRYMLDDVWSDGFVRDVLGQGNDIVPLSGAKQWSMTKREEKKP